MKQEKDTTTKSELLKCEKHHHRLCYEESCMDCDELYEEIDKLVNLKMKENWEKYKRLQK
tara:strand:+ start:627 stop:806 length:180 start_codon:yes stop_codon:yes gene_type:complete